jgi:DNA-binding protein H-NS
VGNIWDIADQPFTLLRITCAVDGRIQRREIEMAKAALKNMDVDALLELRADVDKALRERSRDLERQIALLGGGGPKRGRPTGGAGRMSALKGKAVPPKYRGPDGETWAGRGATPRWLAALLKEGHSIEEFAIAKGRKRAGAAAKTAKKRNAAANGRRSKKKATAEAA